MHPNNPTTLKLREMTFASCISIAGSKGSSLWWHYYWLIFMEEESQTRKIAVL
jgi:hypothetical protein